MRLRNYVGLDCPLDEAQATAAMMGAWLGGWQWRSAMTAPAMLDWATRDLFPIEGQKAECGCKQTSSDGVHLVAINIDNGAAIHS
jgi:hypothetical protein